MSRISRTLMVFILLAALALPSSARTVQGRESRTLSLADVLPKVWTAIVDGAKWSASVVATGEPPVPSGASSDTDGRGACDPNGSTLCGR